MTEAAGKSGTIVFNRCRCTNAGNHTYPVGGFGADSLDIKTRVHFIHCYFQQGYAHFREMHASNWTLEKCRLDDAYNCDDCTADPSVMDYVASETQGYGTDYGSWYLGQMAAVSVDSGSGDWAVNLTLDQGVSCICVYLEDRAGNVSPDVWVDMLVDSMAPEIQAIVPKDGTYTNTRPETIDITYLEHTTRLDMDNCILSIKDMAMSDIPGDWEDTGTQSGSGTLSFTPAAELEQGTYQLELRLQDTLGNQGTPLLSYFTIDTTPPDAPEIDAVVSPTDAVTQAITGTKEAYAALIVDQETISEYTAQTTWSHTVTLAPGQNSIEFALQDRAGNISDAATAEIFFDNTPPPAVDNLVLDPDGDGRTVSLDWSGYDESLQGDVAGYRIYAQPAAFTSVTGLTAAKTIDAGTFKTTITGLDRNTQYWFAVIACDQAGNARDTAAPAQTTPVDIIAPENPSDLSIQSFNDHLALSFTASSNSHGDLAGYRVYLNGGTQATFLSPDATGYHKTGLTPATRYTFKLTAVDEDGNESTGLSIEGYTFLDNPSGLAAMPYSGFIRLSWQVSQPSGYLRHYKIYKNTAPFTDVSGMAPVRTTTDLSASLTGLDNNTTYYFAVTAVNLSGGEQTAVTPVSATPANDTQGPSLSAILLEGSPLIDGMALPDSGFVTVDMADQSGISYVAFSFNGQLVRKDYSSPYSAYIDIHDLADGSYTLEISATDTLGNTTTYTYTLVVGLAAPSVPVITAPAGNTLTNEPVATISGTCDKHVDITLYLNGEAVDPTTTVGALGMFDIALTLNEEQNHIHATATSSRFTRAGCRPWTRRGPFPAKLRPKVPSLWPGMPWKAPLGTRSTARPPVKPD